MVTALQRLQNHARLVSEPDLSLTDRPRPSEGRFKKSVYFQCLVVIGRASFSKVQPIAQFVAKPEDGRRAVDVGGKWTFAAACISDCFKPSIASIAAFTAVRNYV